MRTWPSRRIRFTFQESASLITSRLPFSPATQTGVETGVPSRLKVVMLTTARSRARLSSSRSPLGGKVRRGPASRAGALTPASGCVSSSRLRLPQIRRSWPRPIIPTNGAINFRAPRGRTSHDQRIRVPPGTDSNVSAPSVSIIDERVSDPEAPRPLVRRELDHHRHRPTHRLQLRPESRSQPDRTLRDQLGVNHPRVEARLVALVGDEVEHLLDRPLDHDLALDLGHYSSVPSVPVGSQRVDALRGAERHERSVVNELAHGGLGAEVTPSEDRRK